MKKIFTLLMLILLSSIHAQDITYKITEIKVNGNSIADNAPIEFGSSSSLLFDLRLHLQNLMH